MSKHEVRFRVRYAETDQMGVVHHANYLIWMEIGRVELVRQRGFNYKDLEDEAGIFLSVVEVHCRYIYPARYDDEISVQTEVLRANSRLMEFSYDIRTTCADRLLAAGTTKHVWLGRDMRLSRLPEQYHQMLALA